MKLQVYMLKNKETGEFATTEFGTISEKKPEYSWNENRAISTKFYRNAKNARNALSKNWSPDKHEVVPVTVVIEEGHAN